MYNFCTLFDSNYLHKGLALYESLCNVCDEFHLYVVAFDDRCITKLQQLKLDKLTVISLTEFETKELLAVKPTRNRAEYCWTCGPSVIYHFIQHFQLDHCTYVDADLMFFSSPEVIFDEIGANSIAITEHIPDGPEMIAGKYCVQFVYFKNDLDGIEALTWWMNSCIDWCYARYENGKFGDQKYLEFFPSLFSNVHIIKHRGAGVAPWNIHLYDFKDFGKIYFEQKSIEIIFFHYHGVRIVLENKKIRIIIIDSDVNKSLKKNIYLPYLRLIGDIYYNFHNIKIETFSVFGRNYLKKTFALIKLYFRNMKLFRYIYYNVFKVKYNGYDK